MMKALLLNAESKTATVQSIPIPELDSHASSNKRQLLIRIEAIALNPVDSIYVHNPIASTGRVVGSDFAGIVVGIFPSPPPTSTDSHEEDHTNIQVGDRIAGLVQGSNSKNPRPGAFAEYLLLEDGDTELVWKIPQWMTFEQAAAVSLCGLTSAQGAYYRLGIPAPFNWVGGPQAPSTTSASEGEEDETITVLIYGATTSLGLYAAQLVNLGFSSSRNKTSKTPRLNLIGLASPSKFAMLKSAPYNYTHLLDYHSPAWPSQVRNLTIPTGKGVDLALDCISEGTTVTNILSTLAKNEKSKLAIFRSKASGAWKLPTQDGTIDVNKAIYGAVWEGLGHDILYGNGMTIQATEQSREFTKGFYRWLSSTSSSEVGDLEPNPIRVMPGGLEKIVPDGFALLGGGRMEDRGQKREEEWMRPVSAEKLVYKIRE